MVVSDIFDNTPCGWCYLNGGGYWTSSAAFYATGTNRPFTVSGYGSTGPLLQSSPCGSDYGCAWCVQSSKGGGVSFILLPRVDGSSHLPPVVAGPCNSPRAQRGSSAPLGPPPGRPARACAVSLRHSLYLCNQHPPLPPPIVQCWRLLPRRLRLSDDLHSWKLLPGGRGRADALCRRSPVHGGPVGPRRGRLVPRWILLCLREPHGGVRGRLLWREWRALRLDVLGRLLRGLLLVSLHCAQAAAAAAADVSHFTTIIAATPLPRTSAALLARRRRRRTHARPVATAPRALRALCHALSAPSVRPSRLRRHRARAWGECQWGDAGGVPVGQRLILARSIPSRRPSRSAGSWCAANSASPGVCPAGSCAWCSSSSQARELGAETLLLPLLVAPSRLPRWRDEHLAVCRGVVGHDGPGDVRMLRPLQPGVLLHRRLHERDAEHLRHGGLLLPRGILRARDLPRRESGQWGGRRIAGWPAVLWPLASLPCSHCLPQGSYCTGAAVYPISCTAVREEGACISEGRRFLTPCMSWLHAQSSPPSQGFYCPSGSSSATLTCYGGYYGTGGSSTVRDGVARSTAWVPRPATTASLPHPRSLTARRRAPPATSAPPDRRHPTSVEGA